ncbi:CEA20 protein, partial [Polypterus senegalus]
MNGKERKERRRLLESTEQEKAGESERARKELVSNVTITAKPGQPIENKNFSLTCDASGQVDSIHWVKNDQPVSPFGHITLSADSKTLSFNPVLRSDNGGYKCTASNPVSKMSSEVYTLTVSYGPEQVSISGSSDVTVGAEVKLTCSAVSQPLLSLPGI